MQLRLIDSIEVCSTVVKTERASASTIQSIFIDGHYAGNSVKVVWKKMFSTTSSSRILGPDTLRILQGNDYVLLMPWDYNKRTPSQDYQTLIIPAQAYNNFHRALQCIDIIDELGYNPYRSLSNKERLKSSDIADIWRWTTPIQALGGDHVWEIINRSNILAAEPDDIDKIMDAINTTIEEWQNDESPCELRSVSDEDIVQTLYLDGEGLNSYGFSFSQSGTIDWHPLVQTADGYAIHLEPVLVALKN